MDAMNTVSAAPQVQAPIPTADLRPTADAAALRHDPSPVNPLPLPPSLGQQAEVNQSRISTTKSIGEVAEIERVLKPYGVNMLPDGPVKEPSDDTDALQDDDAGDADKASTLASGTADSGVPAAEDRGNAIDPDADAPAKQLA